MPVLAAYGSLAFPLAAGFIALQVIVPTFYAQALGLSLSAVGGILLVARLWRRKTGRSMLTGRSALIFALFAASLLAQSDAGTRRAWRKFRSDQTAKVLKARLP